MLCSRPCSSPKKVTSTWLFPYMVRISLNYIYLIKFCSFQLYRNKMVSYTSATCFSHLAQFVRFIHFDMFDCYLYTFTDELIRNIFGYPFSWWWTLMLFLFLFHSDKPCCYMDSCACLLVHIRPLWGMKVPAELPALSC